MAPNMTSQSSDSTFLKTPLKDKEGEGGGRERERERKSERNDSSENPSLILPVIIPPQKCKYYI